MAIVLFNNLDSYIEYDSFYYTDYNADYFQIIVCRDYFLDFQTYLVLNRIWDIQFYRQ